MCKDFSQIDLDNVQSTFQSNILQMFAITKFALPHMKKGGSYVLIPCQQYTFISLRYWCAEQPDSIINTTSVVAFRGAASMVDYASTKGAIVGFTRALSKNLTPKGIRVNAVA